MKDLACLIGRHQVETYLEIAEVSRDQKRIRFLSGVGCRCGHIERAALPASAWMSKTNAAIGAEQRRMKTRPQDYKRGGEAR